MSVRLCVLIVLHNGVKKDSRDKGVIREVVSERRIRRTVAGVRSFTPQCLRDI